MKMRKWVGNGWEMELGKWNGGNGPGKWTWEVGSLEQTRPTITAGPLLIHGAVKCKFLSQPPTP